MWRDDSSGLPGPLLLVPDEHGVARVQIWFGASAEDPRIVVGTPAADLVASAGALGVPRLLTGLALVDRPCCVRITALLGMIERYQLALNVASLVPSAG